MIVVGFHFKNQNPKILSNDLTFVGKYPTYPLSLETQYPNYDLPFYYKGQMSVVEFKC